MRNCQQWQVRIVMRTGCRPVVKHVKGWWIGWIKEVPGVNAQERTKKELMRSLNEVLREAAEFKTK